MTSVIALLISLALVLAGGGLRMAIRKRWSKESTALDLLMDAIIGLGLLSIVIFIFGIFQLYGSAGRWVMLSVIAVLVIVFGLRYAAVVWRKLAGYLRMKCSVPVVAVAAVIMLVAVCLLICALAPPSMDDWDSLAYHLSVPSLYISHGGIYYINFTSHSNFPFLMEMLYVPGLMLGSAVAAKLMSFWMGVLLVALCGVLAKRHFGPSAAQIAMLGMLSAPIVLWEATSAYIDLATALYTLAAIGAFLDYLDDPKWQPLICSAICAGFAASTKMTGLAIIPIIMLFMIIYRRKIEWKPLGIFALVSLVVCSPWYLKTLIYTGNPVYPFFYSVFGGRHWTAQLASIYSASQATFGTGHSLLSIVTMPYNLTLHPERFYDTPGMNIGPIFAIGTLSLLMLIKWRSRKLGALALIFGAQMLIWFLLTQQSRYLIPAMGTLVLLIAGLAVKAREHPVILRAMLALFGLSAVVGVFTLYPYSQTPNVQKVRTCWAVVSGEISADEYLAHTLDSYNATTFINDTLPEDAKIALYGDTRGLYLKRDYIWADPGHNDLFIGEYQNIDQLEARWKALGVTHLMINFRFFVKYPQSKGVGRLIYQAIMDHRLVPIFPGNYDLRGVRVFEIAPSD